MNDYISPIIMIQEKIVEEVEENIYKTVVRYGFTVDKEELTKALKYDRDQYNIGYQNGYEVGYEAGKEAILNKFEEFCTTKLTEVAR